MLTSMSFLSFLLSLNLGGRPPERTVRVEVTAYCLQGRTASGRMTGPGVVAVDTNLIPLGSQVHVPGYGWALAADSCPRPGVVDVWLPSESSCYQWGTRSLTVKVRK